MHHLSSMGFFVWEDAAIAYMYIGFNPDRVDG